MSRQPRTVARETSLDEALDLMDRLHVRHLPVVDGERVVGVVSDRDLLEATGWLPSRVHAARATPGVDERAEVVGEIMTSDVVSGSPEQSLANAAGALISQKIGCLPIEEDGALVGILTETDLIEALLQEHRDNPSAVREWSRVEELMTHSPSTTTPATGLGEARQILLVNDVRHIPVVDGGRLVGMLSDRSLRRASGQGVHETTSVDRVMSRSVATVERDATVELAAERMLEHRISALPVVAGEAGLVGILTIEDLLDGFLDGLDESRRSTTP